MIITAAPAGMGRLLKMVERINSAAETQIVVLDDYLPPALLVELADGVRVVSPLIDSAPQLLQWMLNGTVGKGDHLYINWPLKYTPEDFCAMDYLAGYLGVHLHLEIQLPDSSIEKLAARGVETLVIEWDSYSEPVENHSTAWLCDMGVC